MTDRRAFIVGGAAVAFAGAWPAAAHHLGPTTHFDIPESALREAVGLPSTFRLGARNGDVTLVEFFDYNCFYCRQSARELDRMIASDRRLRVILVNYAVLGEPSVAAAKVALAVAAERPESYPDFHRALFALRGVVGAEEALGVAEKLGVAADDLLETANSDVTVAALRAAATFGTNLNLSATPSWLIGRQAFVGSLTMAQQQAAIREARGV